MSVVRVPWTTAQEAVIDAIDTRLRVGGRWCEAEGGATFPVHNPATGQVLTEVADASADDARRAMDAAAQAAPGWARTPPRERAEILRHAFELVVARTETFALVMTAEMGKPLAESRAEVTYGAEFLRWFSEEAPRVSGRSLVVPEGTNRVVTHRRPVGPCLLITPWNFPLAMGTRKIAPALAAGCTLILKPASLTPLTSHLLVQTLVEAGVPEGVVNLLPTSRSGETTAPVLEDRRLRKLSFTGSTKVGSALLAQAAPNLLRTSMELGGNAPFLVFEDVDLDAAVDAAAVAKLRNGGEACTAANRFLVHESLAERFASALAERFATLRVGDGRGDGVDLGPLVDDDALDKVTGLVDDAVQRGARVLTGGERLEGPGTFYAPTVLTRVAPGSRLLDEEIFGPVAPVTTFTDEEEAVAEANRTPFGLIAYACTRDLARATRLGETLEAGMIAIGTGLVSNAAAPFGGMKQSGLGREGSAEGIAEYLETVAVSTPDPFSR